MIRRLIQESLEFLFVLLCFLIFIFIAFLTFCLCNAYIGGIPGFFAGLGIIGLVDFPLLLLVLTRFIKLPSWLK